MNSDYIIAIIAFLVVTTFIYFNNLRKMNLMIGKKRRKKDIKEIIEIKYLSITYGIVKEKILTKKFMLIISIIDAFIISSVFLVITLLPYGIFWQLLVGFVMLLGLIYSIYSILGKLLSKKGYDQK